MEKENKLKANLELAMDILKEINFKVWSVQVDYRDINLYCEYNIEIIKALKKYGFETITKDSGYITLIKSNIEVVFL